MTPNDVTVRFVRVEEYENGSAWNYKNNIYPFHTLYFVLDGDGFVRTGAEITALERGHVYLIPARVKYDCWCAQYIHKLYAEAHVESVPGTDLLAAHTHVLRLPYDVEEMRKLIAALPGALSEQLYLRAEVEKVIARFMAAAAQPPVSELEIFRPILRDIAHNPSARLRMGDLARAHGWHPSALSRAFHKAFSCSMKKYVDEYLMNLLREELILTDKSLKNLADQYRFCDEYYLSAFFKRHEGVSPRAYRERNRRK